MDEIVFARKAETVVDPGERVIQECGSSALLRAASDFLVVEDAVDCQMLIFISCKKAF